MRERRSRCPTRSRDDAARHGKNSPHLQLPPLTGYGSSSARRQCRQVHGRASGLVVATACCLVVAAAAPLLRGIVAFLPSPGSRSLLSARRAAELQAEAAGTEHLERRRALFSLVPGMMLGGAALENAAEAVQQVPPWQGRYNDTDHPGCKRDVYVDGMQVKLIATDGRPGCMKGEKQRAWNTTGRINIASYNEMIIDYRVRAGPERWILKWQDDGVVTQDGIKWKRLGDVEGPAPAD
eukprot:TRINITY_DN30458_c0_g1_i1.p1 TRINITY_DN30458_c0_g1~~TRINITY_DN30458_c0_g1_i1.p1  ORF type:complete len:260 (+),score=40.14 TRINITY_DN30458_c0_g1_i1:69-782(+)